jgi:hypothetical protein
MSQNNLIKQKLENIAAEDVPAIDLRERIEARVYPTQVRQRRLRISPLVIIGLAILAVFAVAGTVYATSSGFRQLFRMDPRMQNIDPTTMGQKLDLSQTLDGVTAKLAWTYANKDRVFVGFNLSAIDGRRFDPYHLQLIDPSGIVYPFDFGYGVTGHSDLLGVDLPAGSNDYIYAFDLPAGVQTGQVLALTFRVTADELIIPTNSAPQPTQDGGGGPATVVLEPLPVGQRVGPFEFHFTVKVSP